MCLQIAMGILLEDFQIGVPGDDVPARWRRFLGVWETDNSTGRKIVLIVTKVDKAGAADGFCLFCLQRSDAHPSTRTPPNVMKMVGRISDDTLRSSGPSGGNYKLTLMSTNRLLFFSPTRQGQVGRRRSVDYGALLKLSNPANARPLDRMLHQLCAIPFRGPIGGDG